MFTWKKANLLAGQMRFKKQLRDPSKSICYKRVALEGFGGSSVLIKSRYRKRTTDKKKKLYSEVKCFQNNRAVLIITIVERGKQVFTP